MEKNNKSKDLKTLIEKEALGQMPLFPPKKVSTGEFMNEKELMDLFNFFKEELKKDKYDFETERFKSIVKDLENKGGKKMLENGRSRISFSYIFGGFYMMLEEEIIQAQGLYDNTKFRFHNIDQVDKLIEALKKVKNLMMSINPSKSNE